METVLECLELLDWKRRIFELYAGVRRSRDPKAAWVRWRAARDELFSTHPQSPIPEPDRAAFPGLAYFEYDPRARVVADVDPTSLGSTELQTSGDGSYRFVRFAVARFELFGAAVSLDLYWLEGYGGGLFVPFRDGTSGSETYGGGRYVLDSAKGADLGTEGGRLVLDFNFSYPPSCAYDPRWVCPLAPPANWLRIPIRAGERLTAGEALVTE